MPLNRASLQSVCVMFVFPQSFNSTYVYNVSMNACLKLPVCAHACTSDRRDWDRNVILMNARVG